MPRQTDLEKYPADILIFMLAAGDAQGHEALTIHYAQRKEAVTQCHYLNAFRRAHAKRLAQKKNELERLRISPKDGGKKLTIFEQIAIDRAAPDEAEAAAKTASLEIQRLASEIKQMQSEQDIMQTVVVRVIKDKVGDGATLMASNGRDTTLPHLEQAVREAMLKNPEGFQSPTSLMIKDLLEINNEPH